MATERAQSNGNAFASGLPTMKNGHIGRNSDSTNKSTEGQLRACKSTANDDIGLPQPAETALYNVAFFMLTILLFFGLLTAYFLFFDFVKPMLWALIAGIMLFPLKRKLVNVAKSWLDHLCSTNTPLTLALVTLPLNLTLELGEFMLDLATENLKAVLCIGASFPACSLFLYYETMPKLLVQVKKMVQNIDKFVGFFNRPWVPSCFVAYMVYVIIFDIFAPNRNNKSHGALKSKIVSWSLWMAMLAYTCAYCGPFAMPVFVTIIAISSTYYFTPKSENLFVRNSSTSATGDDKEKQTKEVSDDELEPSKKPNSASLLTHSDVDADDSTGASKPTESNTPKLDINESYQYLKYLCLGCFFVWISLHLWIMFILIVPLGLAMLKRIFFAFEIFGRMKNAVSIISDKLHHDSELFSPTPLRHFCQVMIRIDKQVIYWLRESLDIVGSFAAMVVLLIITVGFSGFVLLQLYYESVHLVHLAGNIANQTLTSDTNFQAWLIKSVNVSSVTELSDQAVQKAYGLGRNWLSAQVHEVITNDDEKAKLLEMQIMSTLDSFFHHWVNRTNGTDLSLYEKDTKKSALAQWNNLWSELEDYNMWDLIDQFQEYISLAWTLAESAWNALKSNLEVLLIGISQMMSTVIASGTAVIEFFLNLIVFFTFLIFLLTSSDEEYKPIKLFKEVLPIGQVWTVRLTREMEDAVSSIFLATIKMAVFYGLLTWLTHTLFAVNVVLIPTITAAVFAAIPFFGTYMVAIPAVLELWLIRGEPFLAVLLFIIHYGTPYFVDDAIYSEIRLTNPFVTGMAIAGGMLWWGLEGAILGPLVLCGLLVIGSIYTDVLKYYAPCSK